MVPFPVPIKTTIHIAYTGNQSFKVYIGARRPRTFKVESLIKHGAKIEKGYEGAYAYFDLTQALEDAFLHVHPAIAEKMHPVEIRKHIVLALGYLAGKEKPPTKEEREAVYKEREGKTERDRSQPIFAGHEVFDNDLTLS